LQVEVLLVLFNDRSDVLLGFNGRLIGFRVVVPCAIDAQGIIAIKIFGFNHVKKSQVSLALSLFTFKK